MDRIELRERWLNSEVPALPCRMRDGRVALLITGPRDEDVRNRNWKFGFQVPGENDIRWRQPEQIELRNNALIEIE